MRRLQNPLLPMALASYLSFAIVAAFLLGTSRFLYWGAAILVLLVIWSGVALWKERRGWHKQRDSNWVRRPYRR